MKTIDIIPAAGPIRKHLRVPGSKSITNRALPLAALAEGETLLTGVLFADDTRRMIHALEALGYELRIDEAARTVRVAGRGIEIPRAPGVQTLDCGNSGTTIRFLAAMLSLGHGEYVLDGVARMRDRPIDQLVDQLRALGAEISYDLRDGYPPIRVRAAGLAGGDCHFQDAKSSQYISAILMAAPYAGRGVTMHLIGPVTSEPYVLMTLRMMEQFGIVRQPWSPLASARVFQIGPSRYEAKPGGYAIEPDASNASYFLAAAAIVPQSSITIAGLAKDSLQGDAAFADVLGRMGAAVVYGPDSVTVGAAADGKLHGIDIDMNHIPDMVQTLAVTALFAEGPTTIRNVWNLRVKETDRLAALENELRKLGAGVSTTRDSITITPPAHHVLTPASIATYDDHRMAMAFAVAGLRVAGIRIENPECTAKTYPEFFSDLRAAANS